MNEVSCIPHQLMVCLTRPARSFESCLHPLALRLSPMLLFHSSAPTVAYRPRQPTENLPQRGPLFLTTLTSLHSSRPLAILQRKSPISCIFLIPTISISLPPSVLSHSHSPSGCLRSRGKFMVGLSLLRGTSQPTATVA